MLCACGRIRTNFSFTTTSRKLGRRNHPTLHNRRDRKVTPVFSRTAAFSLVEVLVIVAVVLALAAVFIRPAGKAPGRAQRIKCVNNPKNVGLAFCIFVTDNNDKFPGALLTSNLTDFSAINIGFLVQGDSQGPR